MNGYLVLGRCGMDDIPLRLCADRKLAMCYAESVTPEDVIRTARELLDMTVSMTLGVCLVHFQDGVPVGREWVSDFE